MTVVEIAELAGVSIGTVDRVLHNRGRVAAETREKIQAIIKEKGYQPNPLARQLKRKKQYRVGLLTPELEKESRYWQLVHDGLARAVTELSAFSFSVEHFSFERPITSSLRSAFSHMVEARCDAWIIAPIMQEETLRLLQATENPSPYAFVDSPLPGANPLVTVAQDPYQGGFLAGKLMNLIAPTTGTLAVIRPYTGAFNLNERARGFTSWFANKNGVRVIDLVCPEPNMSEATAVLEQAKRDYPDLGGLFSVSAIGHKIAKIIQKRGWGDTLHLVSYDLIPENEQALRDNRIDCIVSQRPEEQSRIALFQIYAHLVLGKPVEQKIPMPFDIYFKENLSC